jgi:hypothetical protein
MDKQRQSIIVCYHSLISAVIKRAIDDLKGTDPLCTRLDRDKAMFFILSDDFERYCLELGIDCETIREKAAELYQKITAKDFNKRFSPNLRCSRFPPSSSLQQRTGRLR